MLELFAVFPQTAVWFLCFSCSRSASPSAPFLSNDFTRALVLMFSPQSALSHMFAFFLSFCCGFSWETWSCHTPPREGFVLVQSGVFNNILHCILTAVLKSYQVSLIPPSIWQLLSAGFPSSSFSVCAVVILQKPTSFQRERVISMLIWKDPIILSSSSPLCLKHTHWQTHRVSSNTILMRWWPFSCFNCLQLVLIPSEHINHT